MCMHVCIHAGTHGGQERALGCQVVVTGYCKLWMLGTEVRFSRRIIGDNS